MKKTMILGTFLLVLFVCLSVFSGKEVGARERKRKKEGIVLEFHDAYKKKHRTKIDERVRKHPYDTAKFKKLNGKLTYEDANYTSRIGIDVSHHQGKIDWKKVRKAGIAFAFLRIGYRGYGESGSLNVDREFENNLRGAEENGLDVGVYFYSQAKTKKEAANEADFVLKILRKRKLRLPVVYDPEHVLVNGKKVGRNKDVTGRQFTKNALAFGERIRRANYEPAIYANMMWEAFELDMKKLEKYKLWYADYEKKPQTPYDFTYWQYDNEGRVPGINGSFTDMNIELVKKKK